MRITSTPMSPQYPGLTSRNKSANIKYSKFNLIMENNNIIEQRYNERREVPSDINEHLETLYNYALKCETVAEFGVRFVVSSYAFAHAKPKRLLCLDICSFEQVDTFKEECKSEGINMEFVLASSLDYELDEDFDMLFIDTVHNYNQVKGEIEKHHSKIKKYMIFHDTITFGNRDEVGDGPGLIKAINEFLYANNDWRQLEFHTNNNGLTILERVSGK